MPNGADDSASGKLCHSTCVGNQRIGCAKMSALLTSDDFTVQYNGTTTMRPTTSSAAWTRTARTGTMRRVERLLTLGVLRAQYRELDERDEQREQQQDERHRGRLADAEVTEPGVVDQLRERARRIAGSAACQ